jgi:hypothetical protein
VIRIHEQVLQIHRLIAVGDGGETDDVALRADGHHGAALAEGCTRPQQRLGVIEEQVAIAGVGERRPPVDALKDREVRDCRRPSRPRGHGER